MDARPRFGFAPTDEELIDILDRKVDNKPIPVAGIHEVDISQNTPMALSEIFPKLGEREWYFFTMPDRKYPNGTRPDRRCGANGFLKASQANTPIYSAGGEVVGFRKKLIFCEGRRPDDSSTNWKVDEYRLNRPPRTRMSADDMKLDWMLIRMYQTQHWKRKPKQSVPPAANTAAATDDATNRKATEINAANRSSTAEYNALQRLNMGAPAASKFPNFIHDATHHFAGIAPAPVNTINTDYARNLRTMEVAAVNSSYNTLPQPIDSADSNSPDINFIIDFLSIDFSDINIPFLIDNAIRNEPATAIGNYPSVLVTTHTSQMPQQNYLRPDFGFPATNFDTPFPTNTPTDIPRNREATEVVDDRVPVTTKTDNAALQTPQQIDFRRDSDFPATDFNSTHFPTNITPTEIVDDRFPVNTTMDNASQTPRSIDYADLGFPDLDFNREIDFSWNSFP